MDSIVLLDTKKTCNGWCEKTKRHESCSAAMWIKQGKAYSVGIQDIGCLDFAITVVFFDISNSNLSNLGC